MMDTLADTRLSTTEFASLSAIPSDVQVLVSPLSDAPVRADLDFEVPSCYKHNPPRLQPGYLAKFKEETLFYIFYSMPQVC
jgi:CCR4-NOT transcription complex subunit 2